jgi:cyclic pyranopterin phosphate synthase
MQCRYCTSREQIPRLTHDQVLTYEEILRLVRIGVSLGISKVRVTGGEPLVRKGVIPFLARLNRIGGLTDVSVTTNGLLLRDHVASIRSAGIHRINISLDSLDRNKFRDITGIDGFEQVWEGILEAQKQGFNPIKLNVVALKGINDDEFEDFARLTFSFPFHIRFIEYMPMGRPRLDRDPFLLIPEIKRRIASLGKLTPLNGSVNDGPARRYKIEGAMGEIGFISAMSHHFCENCNRLRLTASGHLRPCLLSDRQEDLLDPIRRGCSDEELIDIFLRAVRHKPSDHNLAVHGKGCIHSHMKSIGG